MKLNKARFVLAYPLVLLLFLLANTDERSMRLGFLIALVGEGIRIWANGYIGHLKVARRGTGKGAEQRLGRLITSGPYAFVRHPLYLGTLLIAIGFSIAARMRWFVLVVLALFVLVYRGKMAEEERNLQAEWGEICLDYHRRVRRLIPSWKPYRGEVSRWCWQGIQASKEWRTCIWVSVVMIAMYFREEIFQEQEMIMDADWAKHLFLLGFLAVLVLADIFLGKKSRRGGHPGG